MYCMFSWYSEPSFIWTSLIRICIAHAQYNNYFPAQLHGSKARRKRVVLSISDKLEILDLLDSSVSYTLEEKNSLSITSSCHRDQAVREMGVVSDYSVIRHAFHNLLDKGVRINKGSL